MFEKLLREIDKIQREGKVSIKIAADEKGYLDKECPNEDCESKFKIFEEDWNNKIDKDHIHCPYCGHVDNFDSWWTTEQIAEGRQKAIQQVKGRINKAIGDDAKIFNRKQPKNSFLKISMNFSGNTNSYVFPISSLNELEQEIICQNCETRYSVIGSGFFCPGCGINSAEETFDNTLNTIESIIKNLNVIREAVSGISIDEAANTSRSLIEKGLLDGVMAFQRFCEVTYKKSPKAKNKIPFNVFQRLDEGGMLWKDLFGESYEDWLNKEEYKKLNIYFQRRHLLQHTQGIVDLKYLERCEDNTYKVNQRIIVGEDDVISLISYLRKLNSKIKSGLSN